MNIIGNKLATKLLLSVLAGFCSTAFAAGPKIQITPTHWVFGKVAQNSILSPKFWIKNVGDDTLKIISVKPGCGCTSASLERNSLAPNDSVMAKLTYNTHSGKGRVSKNARVMSNDSTQSSLAIDFAADVFASPDTMSPVRFSPGNLALGEKNRKQIVEIENHGNSIIKILNIDDPISDVKLNIKDKEIKPGMKGRLEFRWQGKPPKNDLDDCVTFTAENDSLARFTIPYVIAGTEPSPSGKPNASNSPTTAPANKLSPNKTGNIGGTGTNNNDKTVQPGGTFHTPIIPSNTDSAQKISDPVEPK